MLFLFFFSFSLLHAGGEKQTGKASYYAKSWTGRKTSNGERLHHDSMTCAHRTYPFGTRLKVTNLSNGKTVVVRVNDRGPFRKGRIIDLSWGAAKKIGMLTKGITMVTVERVDDSFIVPFKPDDSWKDNVEMEFGFDDEEIADDDFPIIPIWMDVDDIKEAQEKAGVPLEERFPRQNAEGEYEFGYDSYLDDNDEEEEEEAEEEADALDEIDASPNSSRVSAKRNYGQ